MIIGNKEYILFMKPQINKENKPVVLQSDQNQVKNLCKYRPEENANMAVGSFHNV